MIEPGPQARRQQEEIIMLDINQSTRNPQRFESDPEGNLTDLSSWSPQHAYRQAELEGLELTEEHMDVIYYLRERYRLKGNEDAGREVLRDLEDRYREYGGRRYLYELFPHGPVSQASRLAGLPLPPHTEDESFGSTM
jgi:tRNA 2-thiouridine synthesizing protein E